MRRLLAKLVAKLQQPREQPPGWAYELMKPIELGE